MATTRVGVKSTSWRPLVAIIRQAPPSTLSVKASWSFSRWWSSELPRVLSGLARKHRRQRIQSQSGIQLRPAGVHGWLQVAATGTAMLETDIFASSICHCNIITLVHVKMLLVGNIGHFDVEIVLARSGGFEDMEVVNIKPLRLWSRCDHAGCTTC